MRAGVVTFEPGMRWPERVEDAALALLLRRRIVFLRSPIQGTVAGDVAAQLLALDTRSDEPITLIIDSPGGDVSGLFTILDTMRTLVSPVNTRCVGMAASGAAVILGAGTGVRSATPNARIMLHQPHGGIQGAQAKDIEIAAKEFLFLKVRLEEILAECTRQSIEQVREDTDRDHWMSAIEAVAYGLIDRVEG
ncbi:MAG: ClpP family protease [Actinomycetota bacterium]